MVFLQIKICKVWLAFWFILFSPKENVENWEALGGNQLVKNIMNTEQKWMIITLNTKKGWE